MKTIWLFILLLLAACAGQADSGPETGPDVVTAVPIPSGFDLEGHRGARGLKPENTLPAFETALDLGVTTLELDLHYTADGVVVIWHDDAITKEKCGLDAAVTADVPDPDSLIKWGDALMISQLPFADLQAYRCDRNPDAGKFPDQDNSPTPLAGDNYHITSLESLFQFAADYAQAAGKSESQRQGAAVVQFNIETKRKPDSPKAINDGFDGENPGPFEQEILRLISQYGLEERVIIQSFDHRSLWAIRSINDAVRLAALTSGRNPDITGFAANGAAVWSPRFSDITAALLEKAHKAGLLVIPWTVNTPDDAQKLIKMGVDGIISDRPDVVLETGDA